MNSPEFDIVLREIAGYVSSSHRPGTRAMRAAHDCLIDSLGCAFEARRNPGCSSVIGPLVPTSRVPNGARVPATSWQLDPVEAAFSTSTLIRWLDYNDAYYGETVIHPSDCIGALLSVADWQSRLCLAQGKPPVLMHNVLDAMIRAYEIMGALALGNAFTTGMGLDHVMLVKIAAAALAVKLLGGTQGEVLNALSNAWIDGQPLALFRRGPDAGARKSWAAGDAAARGVWLALMTMRGEMGYPSALSAKTWGFCDVLNKGKPLTLSGPLGSQVIENVQFKISYPAGVHAQSAAEAAIRLHAAIGKRGRAVSNIKRVEIRSHRYAFGILNRTGILKNFAERDHSMQYIVAVGLLFGRLESSDYEDTVAADPRIDALRAKTVLTEYAPYTAAFYAPEKRANPNAIRVIFDDNTSTSWCEIEYPIGHRRRRKEGQPLLQQKFESGVAAVFAGKRRQAIIQVCGKATALASMPVNAFLDLLST